MPAGGVGKVGTIRVRESESAHLHPLENIGCVLQAGACRVYGEGSVWFDLRGAPPVYGIVVGSYHVVGHYLLGM